ncbi:MAG: hypothetical protein GQ469_02435 [Methanosarcinales archaeon]|nr:hypothetical protein [Methanosarcinales archaeon]
MVDVNDLTQKDGIKDQSTISNNNKSGFEFTNDSPLKAIENNITPIPIEPKITPFFLPSIRATRTAMAFAMANNETGIKSVLKILKYSGDIIFASASNNKCK